MNKIIMAKIGIEHCRKVEWRSRAVEKIKWINRTTEKAEY